MLLPSRTKYRKSQKGGKKMKGNSKAGTSIAFGSFALMSLDSGRFTARQIESCRKVISRTMKRVGKLWIKVFPSTPVKKKPAEVRMGKGKGSVEYWMFKVKPGRILFEVDGVSDEVAMSALSKASYKLPFKAKVIKRIQE